MRYIDAFNHFFPARIYQLLLQSPAGQRDLGKRMRGIPALYEIDERLRVVEFLPRLQPGDLPGHAGDRSTDRTRRITGVGAHRQRRSGRNGRQVSRPFRRLRRFVAHERARGGGQGGRARAGQRRQCHPAPHQCRRRPNRSGPVPADLRDHREIGQADPAASHPHARDGGLPHRDQVKIRDLQRDRLAVRDRRCPCAPCVLRDHGPLPRSEGDLAPSRRHHSVFRRPGRA